MLIQSRNLSGVAGMWPVAGCSQMHMRLTQHATLQLSPIAKMWTTPARCLCQSQATKNGGEGDGEDSPGRTGGCQELRSRKGLKAVVCTSLGARLQQSGAVPINELGGRFGMALSALRGEFDPGADVEVSPRPVGKFCLILGVLSCILYCCSQVSHSAAEH